jgi:hypothetical protein
MLSKREGELATQVGKHAHLVKELATLQNRTKAADHALLTSEEKQFTVQAALQLEEHKGELGQVSAVLSKVQADCRAVRAALDGPVPDIDTCKGNLTGIQEDLTKTLKRLQDVEEKLAELKKGLDWDESVRLALIQQRTAHFESALRVPAHWIRNHLHRYWALWRIKPEVPPPLPEPVVESKEEAIAPITEPIVPEAQAIPRELADLHEFLLAEFEAMRKQSPFATLDEDMELDENLIAKLLADGMTARATGNPADIAFPLFFHTFLAGVTPAVSGGALAHTLRKLDAAGRRTSQFLASLLHIGSGYPIFARWSYNISAIFAAVREILDKKGRLKGETVLPLETRVGLAEVLEFIYANLSTNTQTGEELIKLLKPQAVENEDFIMFVLSNKMSEKHVDNVGLFRRVDTAGKGKIQLAQFVSGMQEVLGVWLSSDDLYALVKGLAKKGSDELSRIEFLRLNLKTYLKNASSDLYTVSLLELLAALHQAFVLHCQRLTAKLIATLESVNLLDELDFAVRVRALCGEGEIDIAGMWREVGELKLSGASSLEAAVRVLLRHEVNPIS